MWVVSYKPKDSMNLETRLFGPFHYWEDAQDCLCALPVAAECDHKWIMQVDMPDYDQHGKVKLMR